MPMQRYQMKQLLATQEHLHPSLFANLLSAMRPLMGQAPT
jgi:tRNA 2-thiocytidine biosynthesis protein TtcA